MNKIPLSDRKPLIILVLLVIYGVINLTGYFVSIQLGAKIHDFLGGYNLVPKAEVFTELFFQKYPRLSKKDVVRGDAVSFSFTVHNLEGKDMDYNYQVYFNSEKYVKRLIDKDTLNIKNGESKTVTDFYVFRSDQDYGLITVSIPSIKQEISFYLPTK